MTDTTLPSRMTPGSDWRDNTFMPIDLKPESFPKDFAEFVKLLTERIAAFTKLRREYYERRRGASTRWVHGARTSLAYAGATALLLTGLAAALQLLDPTSPQARWALVGVLVLYAAMGAISFVDRSMDRFSSYFRYVMIILTMRDLSTKLQFEMLRELETLEKAANRTEGEAAARERLLTLFEAYCTDIDKASHDEATEWRTEFTASMGELEAASKQRMEDIVQRASDYAAKAEAAAKAAALAAEALKPGGINITIGGTADAAVTILLDDTEVAKGNGKTFAIAPVTAGRHKITAQTTNTDGKMVEAAQVIDVASEIASRTLTL